MKCLPSHPPANDRTEPCSLILHPMNGVEGVIFNIKQTFLCFIVYKTKRRENNTISSSRTVSGHLMWWTFLIFIRSLISSLQHVHVTSTVDFSYFLARCCRNIQFFVAEIKSSRFVLLSLATQYSLPFGSMNFSRGSTFQTLQVVLWRQLSLSMSVCAPCKSSPLFVCYVYTLLFI